MKKIALFFILLLPLALLLGQVSDWDFKDLHQDLGEFEIVIDRGDTINVQAFSTVETFVREFQQTTKGAENVLDTRLRYELYLISNSTYSGQLTKTWLYNVRVFINGLEVTRDRYPEGFLQSVDTEPTLIYSYITDEENIVDFSVTWGESTYDTRIY